ncbi:MAG: phosphatase PAP2 family protein [Candidatus Dormibacteria bacterium]
MASRDTAAKQGHPGTAEAALKEVVRGTPGRATRRAVPIAMVVLAIGFALTTFENINRAFVGVDLGLERAVQSVNWGPLADLMHFTNILGGVRQLVLGAVILVAVALFNRRGALLLAFGSVASLIDQFVKVAVHERRPLPNVVHVAEHANGYSYPSGHAVFYTWVYFLLAVAIAPRLPSRWRVPLFVGAFALIFFACLGRVWAGAHWPSDVLGGFLLGMAWSLFVLWVPERFFPRAKVNP